MGSEWFGLKFRLTAAKPFSNRQIDSAGRVSPLSVVPLPAFETISYSPQELPLEGMSLGTMTGGSTFLNLTDPALISFEEPVLRLRSLWRQLELRFDLTIDCHKSEKWKIILPLKHVSSDRLVINRSLPEAYQHSIFFETSFSPQVWKRHEGIDEADLKERLHWSENELWIRQCDIVQNPLDPLLDKLDTRIIMKHLIMPTGNILPF